MLAILISLTATAQDSSGEEEPTDDAPAEDDASEDEASKDDASGGGPPGIDLSGATEELTGLTEEQHDYLEPKLHRLPPEPYNQTDFTAYTLEWGEFKIGAANVSVGVLPRVELGTSVIMDTLGIPNADIKINALRLGPVDLAVLGSHYAIPLPEFSGSRSQLGAGASVIITDRWSLHTSSHYNIFMADGLPDLTPLGNVVEWLTARLPARNAPLVWGTIHSDNQPSLRCAARVGRQSVDLRWLVPIS